MKILIGLVSSNSWISGNFNKDQDKLINKELRSGNIFSFKVFDPMNKEINIQENLRDSSRGFDAVILLIEWNFENELKYIRDSFFTYVFRFNSSDNYGNFFRHKIGMLLNNLILLDDNASEKTKGELIILPLRNFISEELNELARICREDSVSNTFNNAIVPLIKKLNGRRRPRRNTNDQQKYVIDNDGKCFEFGKDEGHGQIATGGKHLPSCEIAGNFRFGRKIQKGHFNVVRDNKANVTIGGIFPNCHDKEIVVSDRKHINMFANDYIRGEETESV